MQDIASRAAHPEVSKSKALLDHFVATQETRERHCEREEDRSVLELCAGLVYWEVIEEGCRDAAVLAAQELVSVRVGAQRLLETLLVKVRGVRVSARGLPGLLLSIDVRLSNFLFLSSPCLASTSWNYLTYTSVVNLIFSGGAPEMSRSLLSATAGPPRARYSP